MNRKKNVLFIRHCNLPFIQKDLELLKKHFNVEVIDFVLSKKSISKTVRTITKMIVGVLWSDITFSWFAYLHALWAVKLSKFFKKKSIVVIGGYEVANIPEIKYGLMLETKNASIVRYIVNNADIILTVDEGLKIDIIQNVGVEGKNVQTLHTGYDYNIFKPEGEKEDIILTVCSGDSWERARLKGLDIFIGAARLMPKMKFMIVGFQGDELKKIKNLSPQNVEFIDYMSQDSLISYYQKAKIYCQLSMREGLPNALCEAMLCECVPVGTDVQGIRTAIGDTGFYAPYGHVNATVEALNKAVRSNKGKLARERIKMMFPIQRREIELKKIIDVTING